MIQISSTDSSILVKATEGEYIYPSAKTELELPLNSVILTLDESEMAVFRSASNFDVLFTALISNLQIDGASVTKANIADKFADAATSEQGGFKYEVVDELPTEGEKGTIYLVPNEEGTHTEYLYVENVGWEQVGTAKVDLSDYYTKEEVDEGNRVNAAAFNVLQKSIGLTENLETLSGKSIQAQIDEVKESVPTQFKTINNESIVGEGNIEVEVEQNYVIAESESEIPTDPKNGTLLYLNGQFNVVREWSSNESVDIVKDYNEYENTMLLIDVKTTPRYGGAMKLEIYNFESSSYYREQLNINSQEVSLVNEEYSLFNTETNEFNTPYTINSFFGDLYFNVKNYNGVDMLAISWKVANDDCKVKISSADFDSPSGGMYIIEQSPSIMAQFENGDWKEFGGGSSNAYEKVEGIDIASCSEDGCEASGQVGILAVTTEDGKWHPEFYLRSDEEWSSNIDMSVNESETGIWINSADGSYIDMSVNESETGIWINSADGSYIDMSVNESETRIGINSADGSYVNIHSDRLEGYSPEGGGYNIKYSDILTKDDFIKTPNLTLFGAVNVNEGQISDFSAHNYAQFPFLVNLNTPFEINITVTLDNDVNTQHNIIDSDKGLAIAVRNRHFVVAMSSNGQTWDMGEHIGKLDLNVKQTYRLRLSWDSHKYKLAVNPYDTSEENYITDFEFMSNARLFPTQIIVGKAVNNSNYFRGSINLNECSLSINGNKVWEGMGDLGLSTRLATDLSNIDAKGESVINDMIDEKTKKFADQNYQIVDSLDEIAEPKEGMMVYKKGEAPKIDIVTTEDVYYSYFKNTSNEIYIQVEDALLNANGYMYVEIRGTRIFNINTEEGLVILTGNKGFVYFDGEDSLRYNSATFNYSGREYTFNFALTTIDGKKCVKMTVATPDDNMYFSTSGWYQNMETPIFYLGEPTEGETYQYVEKNWKELNADIKEQIGEINTLLENLIG